MERNKEDCLKCDGRRAGLRLYLANGWHAEESRDDVFRHTLYEVFLQLAHDRMDLIDEKIELHREIALLRQLNAVLKQDVMRAKGGQ